MKNIYKQIIIVTLSGILLGLFFTTPELQGIFVQEYRTIGMSLSKIIRLIVTIGVTINVAKYVIKGILSVDTNEGCEQPYK